MVPVRKRFPGASRGGAKNAEMEHLIGFVPSCETIGGAVRAELGLGVPKGDKTLMTIGTLGTIGTQSGALSSRGTCRRPHGPKRPKSPKSPNGPRFRRPVDRPWQNVSVLREHSGGSLYTFERNVTGKRYNLVRPRTGGSQTSGNDVLRIPQAAV